MHFVTKMKSPFLTIASQLPIQMKKTKAKFSVAQSLGSPGRNRTGFMKNYGVCVCLCLGRGGYTKDLFP